MHGVGAKEVTVPTQRPELSSSGQHPLFDLGSGEDRPVQPQGAGQPVGRGQLLLDVAFRFGEGG